MCMVRHSSVFAFSSVNLKEIRMIDEVQGGEATACDPIISRSVPWGRDKVGGDAQAMVTGDDGYFVNEQAAAFIA